MIVVRVELWSARDGSRKELARMHICNDATGTQSQRNYITRTLRGRSAAQLDKNEIQRHGTVKKWPAEHRHVWNLVAVALAAMGYGKVFQPAAITQDNMPGLEEIAGGASRP